MALRRVRYALFVLLVLIILATPSAIYSCGPFLETAVFAFRDQPDGPATKFAAGNLGIVRPGFRISYLIVAYRYLVDLKLTPAQQKAAIEVWNRDAVPDHPGEEESAASWIKARSQVPGLPPAPNISALAPVSAEQPYFQYVNCPGDAFQTAIKTLDDRAARFGLQAAAIKEWTSAQDDVFANCGGSTRVIPAEFATGDPLQRADRAYQIASAHFYARSFDDAVRRFDTIAKDASSPWASISPYLAARALVRKSTLIHKENEQFDPVPMAAAQQRLEHIVADPKMVGIRPAAARLLNFLRFRTEPAKRTAELEQVMLSHDPGPQFKQDLWDYTLLLSHGEQAGDLSDWVKTYAALAPNISNGNQSEELAKHALAAWHTTKAMPWLIASLKATNPSSPAVSSLLADARVVAPSSAGYLSAQYYALELMSAAGQKEAARQELDRLLSIMNPDRTGDSAMPVGSYNLLNDLRLTLTTSLDDFLTHASERVVGADEGPGTDEQIDNPAGARADEKYLPPYSAKTFQKRLPLSLLAESAQSPMLSKALRRNLARSTWVRAVLLNDLNTAMKLQSQIQELDLPLWKSMEPFRSAADPAAKHFAGVFIILQNPGLKPSAQEGLPRTATLGEIENYRDNWWCDSLFGGATWGDTPGTYADPIENAVDRDAGFPFTPWITEIQKKDAQAEWKKLTALGTAPNYLARQVLTRGKEDPKDPLLPQALYLAVRATRYGCADKETSALSKTAFEFLHKNYPESEWATKTKYYY